MEDILQKISELLHESEVFPKYIREILLRHLGELSLLEQQLLLNILLEEKEKIDDLNQ